MPRPSGRRRAARAGPRAPWPLARAWARGLTRGLVGGSIALVGGLTGCVSGAYEGHHRLREPDAARVAVLVDGSDGPTEAHRGPVGLASVLAELGAPLYVWEYRGSGAALAWGGYDSREWSLTGSLPIDQASVSLTYGDVSTGLRGVVLFFDADWRLEHWRSGVLSEIFEGLRRSTNLLGDDGVHGPSS